MKKKENKINPLIDNWDLSNLKEFDTSQLIKAIQYCVNSLLNQLRESKGIKEEDVDIYGKVGEIFVQTVILEIKKRLENKKMIKSEKGKIFFYKGLKIKKISKTFKTGFAYFEFLESGIVEKVNVSEGDIYLIRPERCLK